MNSNKSKASLKVILIKDDLDKNNSKEVKKIPIQESYEDMMEKCRLFLSLDSLVEYDMYYYDDEQDRINIESEDEYQIFYEYAVDSKNKALVLVLCKKGLNVDLGKSFQLNNTSINISQEVKNKDIKQVNKENDDNANIKDDLKKENDRYKSNNHNNINANNDVLNNDKGDLNKDVSNEHNDNLSTISKYSEPNQINKIGGDIVANSQDFTNNQQNPDSKIDKVYSFNPNHKDEDEFCLIKDDKNSENLEKNNNRDKLSKEEIDRENELNEKSKIIELELQKLKDKEAEIKKKAMAELIKKNRLNNILLSSNNKIELNNDKNVNNDNSNNKQDINSNENQIKKDENINKDENPKIVNDLSNNIDSNNHINSNINNNSNNLNNNIGSNNSNNENSNKNQNVNQNYQRNNQYINISFDNNNYLGVKDLHSIITSEVSHLVNIEIDNFKSDLNAKVNNKISLILNHYYSELCQRVKQSNLGEKSNNMNKNCNMNNVEIIHNDTNSNNNNKNLSQNHQNQNQNFIEDKNNVKNNVQQNYDINNQKINDAYINNKGNSYILQDNKVKPLNINDLNKTEMEKIFNLQESVVSKKNDTVIYLLFKNDSNYSVNLNMFKLFFCSNTEDLRENQYSIQMEENKTMINANEKFGVIVKFPNMENLGRFKIYFETIKGIKSDFAFLEIPIVPYKLNEQDYKNLYTINEIDPNKNLYEIARVYINQNKNIDHSINYIINNNQ